MGLAPGTTLGPYEVTARLGVGGMGEVWRAVDSRLGREVAIKVLAEDIEHDADRHARFDREAKLLASLNHPNIATLYEVAHLDGERDMPSHALVMELVSGEGLDECIARGPMPPDEAIAVALQVASGLVAAHERGIVHRDLKPGNVRIRADGTAKVLDFGLAKAWQDDSPDENSAHSATITGSHSRAGTILGTAAYMAPEQARGRRVDHRADIWAFGCLLYEMLAGRRAFPGDTISDTIAGILKEQPRWEPLPRGLDPAVLRVLRRCLAKSPDFRYQHLADARLELLEVAETAAGPYGDQMPERAVQERRRRPSKWLAVAAGVGALALVASALMALRRPPPAHLPTFRPLTFRSAHVGSARFASTGEVVIFGMATSEHSLALYSTRSNSIESRILDLPEADVLDIAHNGRMLILLGRHREGTWVSVGTLAEVDLAGGAPRRLLERVNDGAIAPDGSAIAAVRELGPVQRLEYPLGNALYETEGWISHVRISPDGRQVAFIHHPFYGDDRGLPMLIGPDGKPRALAPETSNSLRGLAWSPDGAAVWYTEYEFGRGARLRSVQPGKRAVDIMRAPLALRLQDIATDGRVLLIAGDSRAEIMGLLAGQDGERRYEGWNDDSIGGITADGRLFAGNQQQSNVEGEYTAYVRAADGSAPVLLGLGHVLGISPDGRWVFLQTMTRDRNRLTLFPTGPGRPLTLDLGDVTPVTSVISLLTCSLDGRRAAFIGRAGEEGTRVYILDLEDLVSGDAGMGAADSSVAAIKPLGEVGAKGAVISPDGALVASLAPDGTVVVYPVDGGAAISVPGMAPGSIPLQWTRDGHGLLVWDRVFPAGIYRVSLGDGRREQVHEIMPDDPAGVLYGQIILAPGGEHYVYRFRRDLNVLIVAEGIH